MPYASATHQGSRSNNEDSFTVANIENHLLLLVADGLGGHNAGEVASELACEVIKQTVKDNIEKALFPSELLFLSIARANEYVLSYARSDSTLEGMATTAVIGLIFGKKVILANIGDSRAYIIRKDEIKQITKDHSLVQSLLDIGAIDEKEAVSHPQKNIVMQSIGSKEGIKPDYYEFEIAKEDILFLCTDGLTDILKDNEILDAIKECRNIQSIPEKLIESVIKKGAKDNITVVVYGEMERC
ncbi:Stp1/IreP family PP2C-type Ser/Thr phosphatase [uncultured Methanomethylovorans sp.]|uniref:Stp1/IreP family PP2C-type Ser/Thr phosphatase n=1 Tax=uncultured Methanomethylovorans sp. TaxID=183759 RepID=UPI002AA792D6|nr:Stp1/IreP family PP2C-type Ser/Thr phosphatase [uncultured Methanomethylovorans sp.]